MKKNKKAAVVIGMILVLCLIVAGIFAMTADGAEREFAEQLELGQKYLDELDYEQAVVAYKAAIEIDPKCEEAYLALAEIYVILEDYENAIDILSKGIEQIGLEKPIELEIEKTSGGIAAWLFILLGLVITVLAAVIIVLIILLLKKKKLNDNHISQTVSKAKPKTNNDSDAQRNLKEESNYNMPVPDRNGDIYPEIILINVNKPDYIYRARIADKVIIGRREGSDIRIVTDLAVSSRHCIISVKGTQFYLEDCNSSNGTRYNDQEVTSQIPIMSGGILEIGHDAYRLMIGS